MKIDFANLIAMYFAISFLLGIFIVTSCYVKSRSQNINQVIVKHCSFMIMEFTKTLEIKDFMGFEKYGVWRYSGRF